MLEPLHSNVLVPSTRYIYYYYFFIGTTASGAEYESVQYPPPLPDIIVAILSAGLWGPSGGIYSPTAVERAVVAQIDTALSWGSDPYEY